MNHNINFSSVRLCEDRLTLIEEGLQTKKGSYRHGSRLLQLATLLRVCGMDLRARQAKVYSLVAHAALKVRLQPYIRIYSVFFFFFICRWFGKKARLSY